MVATDTGTRLGAVVDGRAVDMAGVATADGLGDRTGPTDLKAVLAAGERGREWLADLLATTAASDERFSVSLDQARLAAPYVPGAKILCHVVNYTEHGSEAAIEPPEHPFFFLKPGSSVVGPRDHLVAHRWSTQMDYEVELAVIIGRPGRDISAERAYDHVAGYAVMNDVSYRDLQFNRAAPKLSTRFGQNWTQGKGLDASCPLGPWITLTDEIPEPYPLAIRAWVDDHLRQDGTTGHQIFRVPELIEHISRGMTLQPGDVIATGTPAGSGIADGSYLQIGQTVRCEVEGLGALLNEVIADDGRTTQRSPLTTSDGA
jgi:2-keto-4-pentenoate hydratase/2-oxohepta-3-ene-1,7-dioic acid hydratase in catechol pathway